MISAEWNWGAGAGEVGEPPTSFARGEWFNWDALDLAGVRHDTIDEYLFAYGAD